MEKLLLNICSRVCAEFIRMKIFSEVQLVKIVYDFIFNKKRSSEIYIVGALSFVLALIKFTLYVNLFIF